MYQERARRAYTATCDDHRVRFVIGAGIAAVAAAFAWLARPLRPDPAERAKLAEAVGAVDRELAGNLELMSMFDQTKQAVVLENDAYARHRATLERSARMAAAPADALYERIPETESAMARRGPANSIREEDRWLIEGWEGDAREVQRSLRASLDARPLFGWRALRSRLRARFPSR
jgi:hypothetical protein